LTGGEQPTGAGRAVALARLRSALARTTTTGRPTAVFLVGPAGSGKTGLVREFAAHARRDAEQLWIASLINAGSPDGSGWHGRLAQLGGRPTLMVIEDLHLADAVTCGLIGVIGHVVRRGRLLIVGTYRDDEVATDHPMRTLLADLPPTMVDTVRLAAPATAAEPDCRLGLTVRERQVLLEIAAGRTNRQIARKLFISENTVSIHVSRILAKLEVDNRTAAAAAVHRLGLR
jgi:ATP/maltotriose-dependent transcriptional regulator MalT